MKEIEDYRTPSAEDYLYALEQRNLVYNCDFQYFSNRLDSSHYGIPDGWLYEDSGADASINLNTTTNQCVITKSRDGSVMTFKQAIHEFPRWKETLIGQIVTAKFELNISINGDVNFKLTDGIDSSIVTKNSAGTWEVDLQLEINENASGLYVEIHTKEPLIVLSISRISVNIGSVAIPSLPCMVQGYIGERKQYVATEIPPAGELSLCKAAIELTDDYTRLNSVLNCRFGEGPSGNSMLIDMRGYFSRAWDNGSGADPDADDRTAPGTGTITGDHVSTFEEDIFEKHHHKLKFSTDRPIATGKEGPATIINTSGTSETKDEPTHGKETRPKNIAELYTIKWA